MKSFVNRDLVGSSFKIKKKLNNRVQDLKTNYSSTNFDPEINDHK